MMLQRFCQRGVKGPAENGAIAGSQFGPQVHDLHRRQVQVAELLVARPRLPKPHLGRLDSVSRPLLLHFRPVSHHPLGQAQQGELAPQRPVVSAQVGRGAPQNDRCPLQPGPLQGHLPGMVARCALLLVGCFVLLVHDDAAQAGQWRKEGRSRADDHIRLAGANAPPGIVPLPR